MPPGTWSEGEMYDQYEHVIEPFFKACYKGKMDVIEKLIDQFPIDAVSGIGGPNALIAVCYSELPNSIDIARILIDHGIDVDASNGNWPTALEVILFQEVFNQQLATLVLYNSKLGANYINKYGLSYLIYCKTLESVMFLVENGININYIYGFEIEPITYLDSLISEDNSIEYAKIVQYLTSVGGKRYQDLQI